MKYIDSLHQIILMFCGLTLMLILPDQPWIIIPMLLAVILSGIAAYIENTKFHSAVALLFMGFSLIVPELLIFSALMSYTIELPRPWVLLLLPITLVSSLPFSVKLVIVLLTTVAIFLKISQKRYNHLKKQYLDQSDTMREMTYTLQKTNRDLIAHQEDDIRLATLNERNRIAREIHDHVGHQITSALFQTSALLITRPEDDELKSLRDTLDGAMTSIRSSVHNLYDTSIDLEASIQTLVNAFTVCPISLNLQWDQPPPNAMRLSMIAIVKEGLSNIAKHAEPTTVEINLIEHPIFYQLILSNDGSKKTYTSKQSLPASGHGIGIGLSTMTQRVEALGGRMLVKNRYPGDFTLFMTFPKEPMT